MSGRYGPYVTSGGVNATLPKGADPAAFTLEQAVPLLAERAAAGGGKKAKGKAKAAPKAAPKAAAAKKAPAKKAPAKKPAAKKVAAKKG
jgi:DNA topoisomerase-1